MNTCPLSERPLEQCVIGALHNDEEQRHMCSLAHSVSVQIQTSTHFVSSSAREERRRVNRRHLAGDRILTLLGKVTDLPSHRSIVHCLVHCLQQKGKAVSRRKLLKACCKGISPLSVPVFSKIDNLNCQIHCTNQSTETATRKLRFSWRRV